MKEVARYSGCFVCGENNDCGLNVKFYYHDKKSFAEYTTQKRFEGYMDVFHGGITATLLDEIMIKALLANDVMAMTVEITVKFHKLVKIGEKLFLEGELEKHKGRLLMTSGRAKLGNGEIVASATGKYLIVNDNLKSELLRSLENTSKD